MDRWQWSSLPYLESSPIWWANRDLQQHILLAATIGIAGLLVVVLISTIQPLLPKNYGPTFYYRLGSRNCVVVSSPQISDGILRTHEVAFASRTVSSQTKLFFYGGQTVVTAPYGPFWRLGRKVFTLEILTNKLNQQLQIVRSEEVLSALSSMIEDFLHGKAAGLFQELKHFVLNSFTRIMMNKSYFGPLSSVIDKKEATEMAESSKELIKLGGSLIEGYSKKQNVQVMNMLDVLLTRPTGKEEKPFTDAEIKGLLLIVVLADTASEKVEWTMTQLLKNPHIMKRAQDKLDAVVGRDRLVEEADIPNLRYLRLIVKEIHRHHPATPLLRPHGCGITRDCRVPYTIEHSRIHQHMCHTEGP